MSVYVGGVALSLVLASPPGSSATETEADRCLRAVCSGLCPWKDRSYNLFLFSSFEI